MSKQEYIDSRFDIEALRKLGFWIHGESTYEEYEKRLCTFFSLKNIFMYDYIGMMKNKPVKADPNTFSLN
jgi:hypothetical protein